tara:strand:- start:238 stop:501 length:264 start_codon:yes stop_codon:yes gene_type:complete
MKLKENQILKKLNKIFRNIFSDQKLKINYKTNSSQIEEWDSLNQIKLILACEKEYKVKLNIRDINNLKNVGQMVSLLKKLMDKKKNS